MLRLFVLLAAPCSCEFAYYSISCIHNFLPKYFLYFLSYTVTLLSQHYLHFPLCLVFFSHTNSFHFAFYIGSRLMPLLNYKQATLLQQYLLLYRFLPPPYFFTAVFLFPFQITLLRVPFSRPSLPQELLFHTLLFYSSFISFLASSLFLSSQCLASQVSFSFLQIPFIVMFILLSLFTVFLSFIRSSS